MAKNTLGALENAPGAQERETAHTLRTLAKSQRELADAKAREGVRLSHNSRVYHRWARQAHLTGQMKESPATYAHNSIEAAEGARDCFNACADLRQAAGKNRRKAFKNSVVATVKKVGAKLHF